ncbi:NAD(P)H-dependent oxidoreductase [Bacteroides sp. 519]|uniref:NAD(P)H-dependent oxidoreductase n=1 Tax=Bacteroides sp. 519 TaxID=2302937 RepID=UPI0013D15A81|nr:NAD(P)H-dependent oxidoreductase [Bacteroides sp. 519]NDV59632.1 flavodoxin family protein [Bacteroides sp. 519]
MTKERGRVTVILAHPNLPESKANKELMESVKNLEFVTVYNLYEEQIQMMDLETWTDILFDSEVLVFQFPIYWMSAPYMLKKWMDEIFYSLSRTPVVLGKCLQIVVTTGSDCNAYRSGGKYKFTIDEILRPYQASALHAGMNWETPVVIFGTEAEETGRIISEGSIQYKKKLEELALNNKTVKAFDW